MNDYVILTDSCCDLPADLADELGLVVRPLHVRIGGQEYENLLDGSALPFEKFYGMIHAGEMGSSSAVNMESWETGLQSVLDAGKDALVLAFSSGLSTTCNAAMLAADELRPQYPGRKIYVVDTLCASLGQGMLVYLAAQKKKEGLSIDALRDWTEANKLSICHWVTVGDLETLKRGGRISPTVAFVGGVLQFKPIIHVDEEGKLVNVGKVKGRRASLMRLVDEMEKRAVNPAEQTVFISHSDCLEDAQLVADMIKKRMGTKKFVINWIGPVIGSHTGPGCIALFFAGSPR